MPFHTAELARAAEQVGQFKQALELYRVAIKLWAPACAPLGENGKRELFWPHLWEGCCMTLENVVARVGPYFMLVVMLGLSIGFVTWATNSPGYEDSCLIQLICEQHFAIGHLAVIPL